MASKAFKAGKNKVVKGGDRVDKMMKNLFKFKKSKDNKFRNLTHIPIIGTLEKPTFQAPMLKKPSTV